MSTPLVQPSIEAVPDYAASRFHMVVGQLRPNRVTDERLLSAMGTLARETFVPQPLAGLAYADEDLAVAPGRFLMEPMVLARLIQEAAIKPSDKVLDIAPATGYSTAVLASLAALVVAIESDPALQKRAEANLARLSIGNAETYFGFLAEGHKEKAPYDVILLNGSVEILPNGLIEQLGEGGRLLAVVRHYGPGHAAHTGEARLYEKIRGTMSHRVLFDANVRPLPGFRGEAKFTF